MRLIKSTALIAIIALVVVMAGSAMAQETAPTQYWMFGGARFEDGGHKAVCVGMKLPKILGISNLVYADVGQNAHLDVTPTQWMKADFFGIIDYAFLFTGAVITWDDIRVDNVHSTLGGVAGFGFWKVFHVSKSGVRSGVWLAIKTLTPLPNQDKMRFMGAAGYAFNFI